MENLYEYNKVIQQKVLSKAFHPYLRRFLKEPIIEEKKVLLLITLLKNLPITEEERNQYITATMLLQVALDTHDHVPPDVMVEHSPEELKNRQLTVLAGDYYSGLYYFILSQIEHIELIRYLAEGIKEINEQKVAYHQRNFENEESILRTVTIIESSLITKVSECFCLSEMKVLIESCLLFGLLQRETTKYLGGEESALYQSFAKVLFSKEMTQLSENDLSYLHATIQGHMKATYKSFEEAFRAHFLKNKYVFDVFETFIHEKEANVNFGVEEG